MQDDASTTSRERSCDEDLEVTGLRSKRLVALIVCLVALFVVAIFLLTMNILLITTLQMNGNGIKFLRFHQSFNKNSNQMEKTVEMTGASVELGRVVSNGHVVGFPERNIVAHAPRVIVSAKPNDTRLVMDEKVCKLENTNNFQVVSPEGSTVFSARNPTVAVDKKIKRISASKVITNKVRSGVDESLSIAADDVTIRGNEALRLEGRQIKFTAQTLISFNTSRDGSLLLRGGVRLGGGDATPLATSTSPALTASLEAMRVCACVGRKHLLFAVAATRPCEAHKFCD